MLKINIILFVSILFLIKTCLCDCGCNKIKRDATTISRKPGQSEAEQCSANNPNKNNQCPTSIKNQFGKMSLIPGGNFTIGTDEPIFKEDNESPMRKIVIENFYLDQYEVSNREFERFVAETNYETDAEKFGDSFLFKGQLSEEMQEQYKDYRVVNALWWYKIEKADWRHPDGKQSSIKGELMQINI